MARQAAHATVDRLVGVVPWWEWPLIALWIVGALAAGVALLDAWGWLAGFGVEEQFHRVLRTASPRPLTACAEPSERNQVVKRVLVVLAWPVGLVALTAIPYLPIAIASEDVTAVPGDSDDALILLFCAVSVVLVILLPLDGE